MTKHIVSDGTEHHCDVLFTELVVCEREGDIFYAGGRSHKYERRGAMTAPYVRELVAKLSALLAEYDAERGIEPPVIDDLDLTFASDHIGFKLKAKGQAVGAGRVTHKAAKKAKAFLDEHFPPAKAKIITHARFTGPANALILIAPLLGM